MPAPLLFVHGLGHGAWCWKNWLAAAAEAGYPAYGLSLRGHGGSSGRLRISRLGNYVDDVIAVATSLPAPPVLVGHSMGGLAPDQPGAAAPAWVRTSWVLEGFSEFLPEEVAMILNCSRAEATRAGAIRAVVGPASVTSTAGYGLLPPTSPQRGSASTFG